jgi:hypothetical protein
VRQGDCLEVPEEILLERLQERMVEP